MVDILIISLFCIPLFLVYLLIQLDKRKAKKKEVNTKLIKNETKLLKNQAKKTSPTYSKPNIINQKQPIINNTMLNIKEEKTK